MKRLPIVLRERQLVSDVDGWPRPLTSHASLTMGSNLYDLLGSKKGSLAHSSVEVAR